MIKVFSAETPVFQTAAAPNSSHGLNRSATRSYLCKSVVTAPLQTIQIQPNEAAPFRLPTERFNTS